MTLPRLPLIAAGALALGACDMADLRLQPETRQQAACCCRQCPADAAPAATPAPAPVPAAGPAPRRAAYRRPPSRVREPTYARYDRSEGLAGGGAYGGRYGARAYAGPAVRIEESASSTSTYSYQEGGYAYGYAAAAPGCCQQSRGYRMAGVDDHGYLTWPGKVED